MYDLKKIRDSGALFIRKVAYAIDPNMYNLLPVDDPVEIPPIGWPDEVKISPVPDWEKTVLKYQKKAEEKKERERQKGTDRVKDAGDDENSHAHTDEEEGDDSGIASEI